MKTISNIIRIMLITLLIIVIFMLLAKITGHSPTIDQITLTLIAAIGGAIVKLMTDFYRFEGEIRAHTEITKNTFIKIGNKLDSLEDSINKLKDDIKLIKS